MSPAIRLAAGELLELDLETVDHHLGLRACEAGLSLSTVVKLRADLRAWARHCAEIGGPSTLPATPSRLTSFLASQVDAGLSPSTVRRRAWSLGAVHRLFDLESPTSAPSVSLMLRAMDRAQSGPGKLPITRELAHRVAHLAELTPRDRATVALGFALGSGSVLCGLGWADLRRTATGWRVIVASGEVVILATTDAAQALDCYAVQPGNKPRRPFGCRSTVTRAVKRSMGMLGQPAASYSAKSLAGVGVCS